MLDRLRFFASACLYPCICLLIGGKVAVHAATLVLEGLKSEIQFTNSTHVVETLSVSDITQLKEDVAQLKTDVVTLMDDYRKRSSTASPTGLTSSPTPLRVVYRTCADVKAAFPNSADGLYELEPKDDVKFQGYCSFSKGDKSGYLLVQAWQNGVTSAHDVSVTPSSSSRTFLNFRWLATKEVSSTLVVEYPDGVHSTWEEFSFNQLKTGNCANIDTMKNMNSDAYWWKESSGCTVTGGDYCNIGYKDSPNYLCWSGCDRTNDEDILDKIKKLVGNGGAVYATRLFYWVK